jgi:hypothetical protein
MSNFDIFSSYFVHSLSVTLTTFPPTYRTNTQKTHDTQTDKGMPMMNALEGGKLIRGITQTCEGLKLGGSGGLLSVRGGNKTETRHGFSHVFVLIYSRACQLARSFSVI